jgi:hypothetical protein
MEFGAVSAIPTSLAAESSRILVGMNFDLSTNESRSRKSPSWAFAWRKSSAM